MTCTQDAEYTQNCKKSSILYENVCNTCNPEAVKKAPLVKVRQDVPSLYVGESSRSIYERGEEHWQDWRAKKDSSHILKHQEEVHSWKEEPKFTMRVVRSYRSALARQIGEAVRIRRRGGEGRILNSKAEYNRCTIPRLILYNLDEEELERMEEEELEAKRKLLEDELKEWEDIRYYARESNLKKVKGKIRRIDRKIEAKKRIKAGKEGAEIVKKKRKLSYPVLEEEWGLTVRHHHSHGLDSKFLPGENSPQTRNYYTSRAGRGPPSLAGGGKVVDGAAPHTTMELRRSSVPSLRQTLITESFGKPAHLTLAGKEGDDGQSLVMEVTPHVTLGEEDESGMKGESTEVLVTTEVCEGVQPDVSLSILEGMNIEPVCNVAIVKDNESETVQPSVEESVNCAYKRGVCILHNRKGVKYTMEERKWIDRGRGKGYGYVTRRKVKYRCEVGKLLRTSSSLTK